MERPGAAEASIAAICRVVSCGSVTNSATSGTHARSVATTSASANLINVERVDAVVLTGNRIVV